MAFALSRLSNPPLIPCFCASQAALPNDGVIIAIGSSQTTSVNHGLTWTPHRLRLTVVIDVSQGQPVDRSALMGKDNRIASANRPLSDLSQMWRDRLRLTRSSPRRLGHVRF